MSCDTVWSPLRPYDQILFAMEQKMCHFGSLGLSRVNKLYIKSICHHLVLLEFLQNGVITCTGNEGEKGNRTNQPSLSVPSSTACPVGNMVLTKIPMLPLGESRPPTIENPSPFLPWPFSKTTVWKERLRDFGLRGSVEVEEERWVLCDTCSKWAVCKATHQYRYIQCWQPWK